MTGAASHLAHVSLELGGKSPNIVFEDADLEAAANGVVAGIFAATGQTCMAGSRLLVQESVYDELVGRVAARAASVRLGDPLLAETEMGPVAFAEHRETVESYISVGLRRRRDVAGRRRSSLAARAGVRVFRRADAVRRRAQRHAVGS